MLLHFQVSEVYLKNLETIFRDNHSLNTLLIQKKVY